MFQIRVKEIKVLSAASPPKILILFSIVLMIAGLGGVGLTMMVVVSFLPRYFVRVVPTWQVLSAMPAFTQTSLHQAQSVLVPYLSCHATAPTHDLEVVA